MSSANDSSEAGRLAQLGQRLSEEGRLEEAIAHYEAALKLRPEWSELWNNLGTAQLAAGRTEDACSSFRQSLKGRPHAAPVHANLGRALYLLGELDAAEHHCRRAVAMNPALASAHNNLGNVLKTKHDLAGALSAYRHAIAVDPQHVGAHSNLLAALNYDPSATRQDLLEESRRWAAKHDSNVPTYDTYDNAPDPERPLRIGFVSGDFREHPVARLIEPCFRAHDRADAHFIAYSDAARSDAVTEHLKALADEWHNTFGLTDTMLAERIRHDCVDILIDLAGHTAGNRLLVFARRPAPVQCTWLGFPSTTGLDAVDYLLTDSVVDPEGEPVFCTEEPVRLPWLACYWPDAAAPPTNPLPAASKGYVTFGCLNNPAKYNEHVVALWARLLRSLPQSRLLLFRHTLRGARRKSLIEQFRQQGVSSERISTFNALPAGVHHLAVYHDIDIALDPFPWTGHATTCEALWMGVPVVTLRGSTRASRLSASVLTQAGQEGWIAESGGQYIQIAQTLADDLARLGRIRHELRQHLQSSPVCDAQAMAAALHEALRRMWRRWCEG